LDHYCSLWIVQEETQQKEQWAVAKQTPATAAARQFSF